MNKKKVALALALAIGMTSVPNISAGAAVYNGWEKYGSDWYYYNNGSMKTGWVNDGGTWYYLNGSGAMTTGWQKVNGTWYYLNSNGSMKTGWLNDGGTWYYLNSDGSMKTGWLSSGSTWYFLKDDGAMASGWYYVNSSGAMVAGITENYNAKKYYFNKDGAWVEDTSKSFEISVDDDKLVAGDKAVVVNLINRTDHDYVFNADKNYIQKKDENGLWCLLNIKNDSKKIGNITIKAHSGNAYSIMTDTFKDMKLEPGQYKVENYLGDRYYSYEFEIK